MRECNISKLLNYTNNGWMCVIVGIYWGPSKRRKDTDNHFAQEDRGTGRILRHFQIHQDEASYPSLWQSTTEVGLHQRIPCVSLKGNVFEVWQNAYFKRHWAPCNKPPSLMLNEFKCWRALGVHFVKFSLFKYSQCSWIVDRISSMIMVDVFRCTDCR